MKSANGINLTMLCDFYELTMGNGYFADQMGERICYFDMFFRNVPDDGGYAVAAGLEQIVDYVQKLHFDEEDIAYLRGRGIFSEGFLSYLKNFKFTGDIWAVPEGTPIFPMEPVLTVRAPAIQAQLLETYLLLEFNHQSLIPRGPGAGGAGVRLKARPGHRRGGHRGPRRLHRRLRRHGLHRVRPDLRRPRRGHHGPLLGSDVRHGARRLPQLLPHLPE